MLFFSDAIFAIAITLLVVDIRVLAGSPEFGQVLRDAVPQIIGMAMGQILRIPFPAVPARAEKFLLPATRGAREGRFP